MQQARVVPAGGPARPARNVPVRIDRGLFARVPWGTLGWLLLVVLWITWTPTGPGEPTVRVLPPDRWVEMLGNLGLFAPLSVVLTAAAFGPGNRRKVILWSATVAAVASAAVELGQLGVMGRTVSPYDVFFNAAGAGLAAWAGWWLRRLGVGPLRLVALVGVAVFVCTGLFIAVSGAAASRMLRITGWDADFAIVAGDENGAQRGQRRYRGAVTAAGICAGEEDEQVCAEPGADAVTRRRLTDTAVGSQRIQLVARVVSESDSQVGPTRIVTFSRNGVRRNTMLGQEGSALVLRVRTPLMGPNGSDVEFHLPDAIRTGDSTAVAATYQAGRVGIRADGARRSVAGTFPTGFLTGWRFFVSDNAKRILQPRTLQLAVVTSAAILFLPLGLAMGC